MPKVSGSYKPRIPEDLKYLILHESPGEVKTVASFLPKGYMAMATIGHFMESSSTSLDVDESNWTLKQKVDPKKKDVVSNIQSAVDIIRKNNGKVIIATDPDREWASIARSVIEQFKLKDSEFVAHPNPASLAQKEYMKGINNPDQNINEPLAEAWAVRRILDKYVWFRVTEHLWGRSNNYKVFLDKIQNHINEKVALFESKNGEVLDSNPNIKKIIDSYKTLDFKALEEFDNRKGISFWRVQSVSLILLVLKELEKFEKDLDVKLNIFATDSNKIQWDYSKNAELETDQVKMNAIYTRLQEGFEQGTIKSVKVSNIESTVKNVNPPDPLDTLRAQTSLGSLYGWWVKKIMDLLQVTYEGGLTTYMRTDTNAVTEAEKEYIKAMLEEHTSTKFVDREYKEEWENVQDGHIGILPTDNFDFHNINLLKAKNGKKLEEDHYKVIEYVTRRTVAAFMNPAKIEYFTYTLDVEGEGWTEQFILKDTSIVEEGFLEVFTYSLEKYKQKIFYKEGENLSIIEFILRQKDIKLPWGYTETGFIKELKENGIGRPSTWKDIIETLKGKNYIKMSGKKIEITPKGLWVYQVLIDNPTDFWRFKEIKYTSQMEKELDSIVQQKSTRKSIMDSVKAEIETFYQATQKISGGTELGECPACGKGVIKENTKAWGCSNWKGGCKFTIWKVTLGHEITEEERDYMIANKETKEPISMVSKAGNEFSAKLVFDPKKWFQFEFAN